MFKEAGFGIGGGSIRTNSPAITCYSSSASIILEYENWESIFFKSSFTYAEDIDRLLPEERTNKYYSIMKCINFSVVIEQALSERFFLREGIGTAWLNDRIFPDQNEWVAGASSFISLNYNFKDKSQNKNGFNLALQLDYASAFSGTAPTLTIFSLIAQKSF